MNNNDYIRLSLELNLFFDRIMKEHSFFLETAFMERDKEFRETAKDFGRKFSGLLEEVIQLADGNIGNDFLLSNEIVTKNTLDAENKSSMLSGSRIDTNITVNELNLRSGNIDSNPQLLNRISSINKQTLITVENLVRFKNDILNKVLSCKMYTTNYPLLIKHIMSEGQMFYDLLSKVEAKTMFTAKDIYEQELFWNNIMKEHAEFIRGLLDPTEDKLLLTADKFADEYKMILQNYSDNPNYLTAASLNETISFRDFKIAGEEGILNCKIKSIIIPLLADHVLREANHFIRILKTLKI